MSTKRILAMTLVMIMAFAESSTAYACVSPKDIQFHWAGTAINTLIENNIVSGYEDGRFRPSRYVTREEACLLLTSLAEALGLMQELEVATDSGIVPADVNSTWSLPAIQYMYENNIMAAYPDGTFQPQRPLTRESMASTLYNFYTHFGLLSEEDSFPDCPLTDIENSDAKTPITILYQQGILRGYEDHTYRPADLISRAEIALIIYEISELEAITPAISLPDYRVIEAPYISQLHPVRAPVGCEGTSLLMGMQAKGYAQDIGLHDFLNNMPRHESNPTKGFVGSPFVADPTKKTRTTIDPPVLVAYAKNYGNVVDFSGSAIGELQAEVLDGNPVVVYQTMYWQTPVYRSYEIEGETKRMLSNNHVILLCGYDRKANMYYVADPYNIDNLQEESRYWVDGATFERLYNERRYAIVVQ